MLDKAANTPSVPVPQATSVKDHLAQILDTALRLQSQAEWFRAEVADLFSELRSVTPEPVAPDFGAVFDAAAGLDSAATNVEAEFSTLVDCLNEVVAEA